MHRQQRTLALLNVLGGLAVLGSYWFAFTSAELRAGLWGGVPEDLRGLYQVNMLLAAAGYFPFTALFVFGLTPDEFQRTTGARFGILHLLYALVLLPSAAWLPLTSLMIAEPGAALWWAIRIVLVLVGLGAAGIVFFSLVLARRRGGVLPWLAFVGSLPFFLQTGILDAIIWPAYFPY